MTDINYRRDARKHYRPKSNHIKTFKVDFRYAGWGWEGHTSSSQQAEKKTYKSMSRTSISRVSYRDYYGYSD